MKSRVVIVRNKDVWCDNRIDKEILSAMLDEGMLLISDCRNVADAWKKYFKEDEKISVKLNTITKDSAVSTHKELAMLVGKGIAGVGVKENNISFFDRGIKYEQDTDNYHHRLSLEDAGYTKNVSLKGFKFFEATEYGDWKQIGNLENRFFNVFTESDGHVNMPVLKDHHIMGVTFALKNYVGTLTNPELIHENAGIPYIAELNSRPEVKNTLRLIIGDMLQCQYNNGPHNDPEFHWKENAIILGTDPVAVDTIAFDILLKKRLEYNLSWKEMVFGGVPGGYIKDAALRKKLGTNNLKEIDLIEINH